MFDQSRIDNFRNLFPKVDLSTDEGLLKFAEWFGQMSISIIGNKIYDVFNSGGALKIGMEKTCRCGGCYE